jgi:hypothetical protein
MKHLSRWRTVIAVELLGVNLLAGLWVVCHTEGLVAMFMAAVFAAFAAAIVGLGGVLGGKSMVEHLANGTGTKGAWAALTTAAKPGQVETTETVTSTDVRESSVTTSQQ